MEFNSKCLGVNYVIKLTKNTTHIEANGNYAFERWENEVICRFFQENLKSWSSTTQPFKEKYRIKAVKLNHMMFMFKITMNESKTP